MYDVRNMKTRLGQIGYREPLLCKRCEGQFAKYERRARRLFTDPLPKPRPGTTRLYNITNLDAHTVRYFLLSILWRASVASHDAYKNVAIGVKHEEFLRKALLSEELPPYDKYGCLLFALHYQGEQLKDLLVPPMPSRFEGHKVYEFVFAGIVARYLVSSHPVPDKWKPLLMGANDGVSIYRAELEEFKGLKKAWYGK